MQYWWRLKKVSNSHGYSATFNFANNTTYNSSPPANWYQRNGVDLRNETLSSSVEAAISYAYPVAGTVDVTDTAGNTWRLTATSVRRPGETTPSFSVSGTPTAVTGVTRDGVTTTYSRSVSGSTGTMTKTNGLGQVTTVVSDLAKVRPTAVTVDGKTTSYTYDTSGRLTRVTNHEGDYVNYTLDARGNATSTLYKAKAGSGLADITTSAIYPSTCTNVKTCNQPTSVTDARGKVTDYTYSATHGGVLTVTAPAPGGSGTRPQTRYAYTTLNGEHVLTEVSTCRTNAAPGCVGTADETKTTIVYNSNRNATSVTTAAGNGSLSAVTAMTYSPKGDVLTVDGPLAGAADTTTYRYDAARRLVGTISADPDGAGALKRRAQKLVYDTAGRVTEAIRGTVTGTDDTAWAALVAAEKVTATWTTGRKAKDVLSSGSTTYSVAQYSYDAAGRLECTAQRMNSATWGSLPGSACTLATTGSFGPDRIAKTTYDAANRVTKVQTGFGVSGTQVDEVTTTYTDNGQVATVTDANGNRTTYEYDGHDRLKKTRYPHPTTAGTSSTTDYEELTYDPGSNVTSRRLRDGNSIAYTYDDLSRLTFKNLPGTEPDVSYTYNLVSQMTGASQTGNALTFGFDALGRNTSQTGPQGTVAYTYDLAGNRTRTTWPGGSFYIDYDRLVTGEVTKVRENGATTGVGVLATYAYDDLARRTSLTRGNGVVTSYGYDAVSRLNSLAHNLMGTTHDVTTTFGHNPASQITSRVRSNNSYAPTGLAGVNRNYTRNGLNQYTAAGGTSFGYDTKGNLTTSGTDTYSYSSENLMKTGPASVTLSYDPMLRLYESSTVAQRFAYDGGNIIAEYNTSNVLQARHVFGPGTDEALVSYDAAGNRSWLIADERGSIVAKTDATGAATAIRAYDEYGIPTGGDVGRFQYTGQAWLPELGFYYYKARMYSPTLGRFFQTDPIGYGDGMNMYAYVKNDPVNGIDSTGLCAANGTSSCGAPSFDAHIVVTGQCSWYSPCFGPGDYRGVGGHMPTPTPPIYGGGQGVKIDTEEPQRGEENDPCNARLPDGSTINRNVDAIRRELLNAKRNGGIGAIIARWKRNVSDRGAWDYKLQTGGTDTQGNMNYGATGALLFPESILLRAAGYVQGPNPENRGNWWDLGPSSYGDQPRDQAAIKKGVAQCQGTGR